MSLSYTYNGSAFVGSVPPSSLNPTSLANVGETGMGGLVVDDVGAAQLLVGHKAFTIEESACSQPRLFTGWTTQRDMARSEERGMIVGTDRLHDVNLIDLNALFDFRMIAGTAADRAAESWGARLAWILGSDFLSGLYSGTAFVMAAPPAWTCDAADYRGQTPRAVFDDLCQVSNTYALQYFAFWNPAGTAIDLFLDGEDGCIGTSTLSISNDIADSSATCFFPSEDTTLGRKPDQVYSEVTVNYRSGTKRLFRSRESIATNFIRRGANLDVPRVYSDNAAATVAEAFLDRHDHEIDVVTTTIRVPKASAGLVQAGQRIVVKFTHLPGYATATSVRVVECTPTPIDDLAAYYDIHLVLELPQPSPSTDAGAGCPDPTPSGSYPPLNGGTSDATGNVAYWRSGDAVPVVPTPGYVGNWHFPAWGTAGNPDYAGDCAENRARLLIVGPGTVIIATASYGGARQVRATLTHQSVDGDSDAYPVTDSESDWVTPGTSITVTVPADGFCYHCIDLTDFGDTGSCGSKWGFAGMTWTSGEVDASEDQGFPPGTTLGETPDVNIGTPTDGDALVYDADSGTWGASPIVGSLVSVTDGITTVTPTYSLTVPANSLTDGGGGEAVLDYVTPAYGGQETLDIGTATGTAYAIDLAAGNVHDVTLSSDCALTFTGATADVACSFTLLLRQDGTGGRAVTWPATLVWSGGTAPTLTTTAASVTALAFFTVDGGTSWYGFGGSGGTVDIDSIWALGFRPPALIADAHSTPLIFDDLLQNEAGDDFLYRDL